MDENHPTFTLFYDSDCPFCSREVRWLKSRDTQDRLRLIDIAEDEFDAQNYGKTQKEFMARIHGMTPSGELIEGVEVFQKAYEAVGLGYLLSFTKLPGLKQLSSAGYYLFAKMRVPLGRLFRRCGC